MPLLAAAGISAGSSLLKGILGSNAANSAAHQAAGTYDSAGAGLENLSQAQYAEQQANLAPYLNAGQQGSNSLAAAYAPGGALTQQFSFDPSQIANNPNYQFVLAQGNKAVQQSAAAQGGEFSGGTLKALDQYSQGLATQTVNDAYNQSLSTFQTNHNNLFQGYQTLASNGLAATGQLQNAQALRLSGNEAGSNDYIGGANVQLQGGVAAAQQWNNAISGIAGAAGTYLGTPAATAAPTIPATTNPSNLSMEDYPTGTVNYGPPAPPASQSTQQFLGYGNG